MAGYSGPRVDIQGDWDQFRHDHPVVASTLASEVPLCERCMRAKGLCGRHRRDVLPQLAQPFWYRLVGTDHQKSTYEAMSPEARRVFNRKRTKEARRVARDRQMRGARQKSLASVLAA